MSFNLTTEKWIPVVTQDWQRKELSLIELFERWDKFREIQGENPPTTLALYRFLLAILHRAYQGPRNVDHWEEIKMDGGKKAIAYLQEKADCFDLLHPERPFMQDIVLTENLGNLVYLLHQIQGKNTSTVFCHEHEWSGYSVSIPEAARLLIRLQTIEISIPRANYPAHNVGAKNTKATPMINVPNVIVKGINLKETLLLNLMQYNPDLEIPCVINGEDKCVNKLTITKGDEFPETIDESIWECHIPYSKEKKALRLFKDKQLWRDSYSFLQTSDKYYRPRIMNWIADLYSEELIENILHLQVFGMCADKADPEKWSIENFSAPIEYITNKELGKQLEIAIQISEKHRSIFSWGSDKPYGVLAKVLNNRKVENLAASLDGESRYWATLDRKFTEFLAALPRDSKEDADSITRYGAEELPKWTVTVQKAAEDAFTESIQSIRNYEARANALRSLSYQLRKLRGDIPEKSGKAKKSNKAD